MLLSHVFVCGVIYSGEWWLTVSIFYSTRMIFDMKLQELEGTQNKMHGKAFFHPVNLD